MSAATFIVRPPLFCAHCGYACESIPDPERHDVRTVTCLNASCKQGAVRARIADPRVVLLTDKHDGVVMTQVSQ